MKKSKKIINLEDIKSPQDIKTLNYKELEYLAVSIREFLIESVSKTGGHLASNLGVVELTLGLHYVFNSPTDKIIWDVGHQSYIHKILTGRTNEFSRLRSTGGISGFPKRIESEHDIYDTGHSSTSISSALGFATARDLKKENGEVIAVIGDGSLTGGPAFEAINNIGNSGTKVIIVLNDNGMSISRNIGGLSEHLGKLRSSTRYQNAKEKVKDSLDKVPVIGSGIKSVMGNTKDNLKYMILSGGVMFEELGLTYLGPYDGNDVKDVIQALNQAKNVDGPVIVHLITKKGKGYKPAEMDPNKFHGVGKYNPETGASKSESQITYSDVFGDAICKLANKDKKITAVTAAMCDATGLSKMYKQYPDRVFDVGIAEAHGVIFSAGQALAGLHPVVAIYSSFLQRAYDEIMEDICLQNLPVTFAIDRAGIVGQDGETHHGIFDLSYLIPMPNMTILTPCNASQLKDMLVYAINLNGPTAIRYPRGKADLDSPDDKIFKGENIRLYSGKDLEIYAVGTMLKHAEEARAILQNKGIDAGIVDISIVKKGDSSSELENYLISPKKHNKPIVTIEDNIVTGGFGEYLGGIINNNGLNIKMLNLGWPDKFIEHGDTEDLFNIYGLSPDGIANSITEFMNRD